MPAGFFGSIGNGPSLGVHFQLFGKWGEAIKTLQRLSPSIKQASIAAQSMVAKEIARRVKEHLRQQDLPWRPLSQKYKSQKSAKGWDKRILIGTGTYYHAIEVFTKGSQHLAFVGVRRGIYGKTLDGKKSRLQVAEIAAIHEFSYSAKRRRPLWNPTIREMGGTKGIKELYLQHLYKQLKRRGIPLRKLQGLPRWR